MVKPMSAEAHDAVAVCTCVVAKAGVRCHRPMTAKRRAIDNWKGSAMARIVVIGSRGRIGSKVVAKLTKDGHQGHRRVTDDEVGCPVRTPLPPVILQGAPRPLGRAQHRAGRR
jgi:hypothetical protein